MTNTKSPGVAVVGSANMDIVFSLDRLPKPGETLLAERASRYPGGKGLNQAVASARAAAPTTFIGALGGDDNGDALAEVMRSSGIADSLVRRDSRDTGQAFIMVDSAAENVIVVASGANAVMTELTTDETQAIASAAVLLMQLELPRTIIEAAAAVAQDAGGRVILNAAPASPLSAELLRRLDYLIVNEHEACLIAEIEDVEQASLALAARVDWVIVTLGAAGATVYGSGREIGRVSPPPVTPVDTTGAGDTFCGAFAAAIAEGQDVLAAAEFATVAAALSVESIGAVPSIPARSQIDAAIDKLPK